MKFVLKALGLFALLIIGYLVVYTLFDKGGDAARNATSTTMMSAHPKDGARSFTEAARQNPTTNTREAKAVLEQAAEEAGIEIARLNSVGNQHDVIVRWWGDRLDLGGVFLDNLINAGFLRDFEETHESQMAYDQQGRRVMTAYYRIWSN